MVAIKCPVGKAHACWPPSDPQLGGAVETIAASFVPPTKGSGVRLFNLSPDTQVASLKEGSSSLAANVAYGVGSSWAPVPSGSPLSFSVTDAISSKTIATDTTTPPAAPGVFTLWLIGNSGSTAHASVGGGPFSSRAVSEQDAPHDKNGLLLCPAAAPSPPPAGGH